MCECAKKFEMRGGSVGLGMKCLSKCAWFHVVWQHPILIEVTLWLNQFITEFMSNASRSWENLCSLFTKLIWWLLAFYSVFCLYCWAHFQHDVLYSQWPTRCCRVLSEPPGRRQGASPRCARCCILYLIHPAKKRCVALDLDHSSWMASIKYLALTLSCSTQWPAEPTV